MIRTHKEHNDHNRSPSNGLRNGSGHSNHSMLWQIMGPDGGGEAAGGLADAIDTAFGSFESFKERFASAARGGCALRLGLGVADHLTGRFSCHRDHP